MFYDDMLLYNQRDDIFIMESILCNHIHYYFNSCSHYQKRWDRKKEYLENFSRRSHILFIPFYPHMINYKKQKKATKMKKIEKMEIKYQNFYKKERLSSMNNLFEEIEKGIIIEINDVKEAISVNKAAHAIIIRNFDLELIEETIDAVSIPVIASCRIGHFIEAKILEKIGVAMIDESNPSKMQHMTKNNFSIPFLCKVENMEEARKRIEEGAAAIRTEFGGIDEISGLVKNFIDNSINAKIIPALNIATPADISLLFQIGCNAIIISSEVFRSPNPPKLIDSLVKAARYYNDIEKIFHFSKAINKILPSQAK